MNNSNGTKINTGDHAVVIESRFGLRGRIGIVVSLDGVCECLREKRHILIADSLGADPQWSGWVASGDMAIVEGVAK